MERSLKSPYDNLHGIDDDAQTIETDYEYADIESDSEDDSNEDW